MHAHMNSWKLNPQNVAEHLSAKIELLENFQLYSIIYNPWNKLYYILSMFSRLTRIIATPTLYCTSCRLILFPDQPHPQGGKWVWEHWSIFLVLCTITWLHVHQYKCMQINSHIAESGIGTNTPRPIPRVRGGVWEWDYNCRLQYAHGCGYYYWRMASTTIVFKCAAIVQGPLTLRRVYELALGSPKISNYHLYGGGQIEPLKCDTSVLTREWAFMYLWDTMVLQYLMVMRHFLVLSSGDGGVMKSILHKGDGYSTPTEGAVVEGKDTIFWCLAHNK